jgi:hypothetical protein
LAGPSWCRVQKIPTEINIKRGPEKIEKKTKRNPYHFGGDLLLSWAPHKPKNRIDQKALISTMPCFGEMNMILAAILMLKYQDFDLCHHLTALQQLCDLTSQGPWPCMLFFF